MCEFIIFTSRNRSRCMELACAPWMSFFRNLSKCDAVAFNSASLKAIFSSTNKRAVLGSSVTNNDAAHLRFAESRLIIVQTGQATSDIKRRIGVSNYRITSHWAI